MKGMFKIMIKRKDEEILLEGFRVYLRNRGLAEKSVKDDVSRINMIKKRNIDYTKGKDYARDCLNKSDLSHSSIVSCLRVCKYYKEYLANIVSSKLAQGIANVDVM
ncbi:hypothetical protein [Clostridium sp.]|uniref:hypothetical protein n=1 Tax=Clostridium sp. TaxID=1506 RepID=UPI003D6D3279